MCLSTNVDSLKEDTIWNIEAGLEYLQTLQSELVKSVILSGDIHLSGKTKSVPQMMLEYIQNHHLELYNKLKDKFILEEDSLTSRENIPFGLTKLLNTTDETIFEEHVICTEKLHGKLLRYLLNYHLKRIGEFWDAKTITIIPSKQTILGWRGRLTRYYQMIDIRLSPTGNSSLLYQMVLRRRRKYLAKQY